MAICDECGCVNLAYQECSQHKSEDVTCPFCGEEGFDLIGLRYHLEVHPCQEYQEAVET